MIVISRDLVLAETPGLNFPVIGWRNGVTVSNLIASSAADGFPASNMAEPSTYLRWVADSADAQTLTIAIAAADPIDYVAIAGHNLGSAQIAIAVDGATEETGSPPAPDWTEIVEESLVAGDEPLILRFAPQAFASLRVRLAAGVLPATAAVVYVGKLLVCERGLATDDHAPINLGRATRATNNRSESGQFLGRIVTGQTSQSSAAFAHLTSAWYRAEFDPFLRAAVEQPFFWAWKPSEFPRDVGYCWLTNDPVPMVSRATGRIAIDLQMGAALL